MLRELGALNWREIGRFEFSRGLGALNLRELGDLNFEGVGRFEFLRGVGRFEFLRELGALNLRSWEVRILRELRDLNLWGDWDI